MHRTTLGLLAAVALAFAGQHDSCGGQAPEGEAAAGKALRFKRVSCVDREVMRAEAFSFLAPADWEFQGGISWPLQTVAMPANVAFTVKSPDGAEQLEAFPNLAYFWTNNPTILRLFPVGARYFGAEVRPIMQPTEVLQKVIIPLHRRGVGNLRVVEAKALARAAGPAAGAAPAAAGKVRVEYTLDGKPMEEEFHANLEMLSIPVTTMHGPVVHINWFVNAIFGLRAPKGQLARRSREFDVMVQTFQIDPQWFNKYTQIITMLIQMKIQQIQQIGQVSRLLARTSDEIRESTMKAWEDRNRVYDRVAENFSHHILGIDVYTHPDTGKRVELPSGYDRAFTNGLGDFIVTESPSYNPNIGSNQTWTELKR